MKTNHGQDLPLWVYVLMFSTQLLLCLACIAVVETLLTRLGEEINSGHSFLHGTDHLGRYLRRFSLAVEVQGKS